MKNFAKRVSALVLALVVGAAALCPAALAAASLPDLPKDECVVDDANILSDSTTQTIVDLNNQLQSSCNGAQIGVLTVDYTGNYSTEDYATQALNAWGIGSASENNGVLILLVMESPIYEDGDYYVTYGDGFRNTTLESQASALAQTMEGDFVNRDYSDAVITCANNVADTIASVYGVNLNNGSYDDGSYAEPDDGPTTFEDVVLGIVILFMSLMVMLIIVLFVFRVFIAPIGHAAGWNWGPFAWGYMAGSARRHRPGPPPPPGPGFGPGYGPGYGPGPRNDRPRPPRNNNRRPPRPPMGGGFGGGQTRRNGPQRGESIRASVSVTFLEAAHGCEKDVTIERSEQCPTCKGNGCAPGTTPEICPDCHGSGMVQVQQRTPMGVFASSRPCQRCHGTGKIIHQPCADCGGSGAVRRRKTIKVTIPAGIDHGQTISLRGQGNAGKNGGPAGDLLITVMVRPHELFRREGYDVFCEAPITFSQAVLGAKLKIPTIDDSVEYSIPEGTQTGSVFRLRGKGIPVLNGRGRGDQYVTVVIETPRGLNREQKEALKKFSETLGEKNYEKRKSFLDFLRKK